MDSLSIDSPRQRKRVARACDRCKMKKVKCCGSVPCTRCRNDDAICLAGTRAEREKRMVSRSHVERLYRQQKILMRALRELWKRQATQSELEENEEPSIHDIVASTGVLESAADLQGAVEEFDWDLSCNSDDHSKRLSQALSMKYDCHVAVDAMSDESSTTANADDFLTTPVTSTDDSPTSGLAMSSVTSSPRQGGSIGSDLSPARTRITRHGALGFEKKPSYTQLGRSATSPAALESIQSGIGSVDPERLSRPPPMHPVLDANPALFYNLDLDMNVDWDLDIENYVDEPKIPMSHNEALDFHLFDM